MLNISRQIKNILIAITFLGIVCAQSEVTFDIDGVDDCGFVSVTGTWDGWSGWGAHTDSGMSASIPAGDHEFVILCVNTEGEWWNDIWGSSTIYNAPIDGSCWNGNSEYPNYVLSVDGTGAAMTVSYCVGSCDATCDAGGDGGGDDGGGDGATYSANFTLDGIDDCDWVSITGTFDGWSGWGVAYGDGVTSIGGLEDGSTHEFLVLCAQGDGWWYDIWASSTLLQPELGSECDFVAGDEYANYGFTVNGGDVDVSLCAGTCDATCDAPEPTVLAGAWRIAPEANALMVGEAPNFGGWWSNSAADVDARACLFDDEYVFGEDGSFNNVLGADTWNEGWQGVAEGCGAPVAPHDGSANASYSYDDAAGTVTINGTGAFLGLAKVYNGGECGSPDDAPESITYDIILSDNDETMTLVINFGPGFWTFKLRTSESIDENMVVLGCLDPNAANYDPDATDQALDQWGNIVCVYASCDDVPYDGCMYADAFSGWNEGFGPAECTMYGGTPCEDDVDPCADVTCGDGQECVDGECVSGVQIDLPVDFEGSTVNYTMTDFGGNASSLVTDPDDAGNMAIEIIKTNQAATWAGTTIGTPAGFATNIPLSLSNAVMTVRVWSPQAGMPIRLKVEDSNDPTHTCETETNTTVSGWQVLEFDFVNQAPGTESLSVGLGYGWTYNMASIFFNFGTEGYGETYYFDDVQMCDTCGGGDTVEGCMDPNASNYDANATIQAEDQWGNLLCTYASCDDVPSEGCMYADSFAPWNEFFGPADCTNYGGTPCEDGATTTASANFSIDLNGSGYPNADYDQCGVNGSWNGWGGWGLVLADDDGDGVFTGSLADLADGNYEYVVFCSGAADGWSGWGVVFNAPLGSDCDLFDNTDEYGNYGFTVAGADVDAAYCAGSCDATCNGGGSDLSSDVTFDLDGLDDCGFVSVTGTWDGWSGWGANTDSDMTASIPAGDHEFVILCVNTEGEWWNDIWASSTIYNAPIDGSCWNGNNDYANYVLNVDGSGDPVTVSYCAGTCDATCSDDECTMGDSNGDDIVNVLDIVQIVNYIVSGDTDFDFACADYNGDGELNVLDVVAIVNVIVGGRSDVGDATSGKLIRSNDALSLQANGYIGGVQMTLKHGADFSIELTDKALVADYRTVGDETKLVIVVPGGEELFTHTGNFEIVDMIVANSSERVNVTAPTVFSLSEAYPNPFNPTTSMTLAVPEAGNVSVQVYNIMGQVVATLASGYMDASTYTLTWDASEVSSGMYFVKAEAAGSVTTQKLVLMK